MALFADDDEDVPLIYAVAESAPRNAMVLIRRMALRDPDLSVVDAKLLATQAGIRISPASISITVADFRACYTLIERAGLLRRDADERRRALDSDLIAIVKRARRRKRRTSRQWR